MTKKVNRRQAIRAGALAGAGAGLALAGCEKAPQQTGESRQPGERSSFANEEYVWVSANSNLPLFTAHDHPALRLAGEELGVKVQIAGPNSIDIPGLVAAIEQTAARKPAGMMVVGWDPSALVPPINHAVENGVPVVCVDADVPASKRLAFIGTDWYDLGIRQAEAMVKGLAGKRGKIALLGLIEQTIDQQAFAGFRSVAEKAGLTVLEPQQDKGNQAEAARVAAAILQAHPDLAGMAGFDSESGPGMGQAIREAGKAGKIIATCVDAEEQHLRLVRDGVLTAAVGQKRELFTYVGVKALFEALHSKVRFTSDDKAAGVIPIPVNYNTGTYTVTRENIALFLKSA
ncbi:MAG: substrate-binding domain-containing protein [Verrucomicrobia subdivision 3 bacterium]|nr:substrate-binding domain-containing protein [Limisphaerales bacterium]